MEFYTLRDPKVIALQEAYVRKVIDTVNDLNNVLYEICNEAGPYSTKWQYHMIRFIKRYESGKPKQHPVGMTFQYRGGSNKTLLEGPADWISPNPEGGYRDDPPTADGRKVVISDTDHLWGIGGTRQWVWKSFLRGLHPIYMDPFDDRSSDEIRRNLGYTLRYAERMNLAAVVPRPDLSSTGYCLADEGKEYLVYLSEGGEVRVDLRGSHGTFHVEWFDLHMDKAVDGGAVEGSAKCSLQAPFNGDAVLYLKTG